MIKLLETPEETTTKIPCLTGLDHCLNEEDKRNCHTCMYVTSIMTVRFSMFLNKENIIGLYLSICAICFVAFVCILYRFMFAGCERMFVWLYQVTHVMHSWFDMTYHIFKAIPFLRRFLFCQM